MKIAVVAVARKDVVYYLAFACDGERHVEESFEKAADSVKSAYRGHVPLEEMALILRNAGYTVVGGSNG